MITTGFIILYINAVIIITDQIQYLSLPVPLPLLALAQGGAESERSANGVAKCERFPGVKRRERHGKVR